MAEEAQKTEPEAEKPAAAPAEAPKAKSKLPLVLGGVGLLVVLGGAGWFLLGGKKGGAGHGEDAHAAAEEDGPVPSKQTFGALLPLDPFVANLADEDGKRYLKANLQIEFYQPTVPEEFNQRMPQVRDLLLTLFTSKLFSEIRTPAGKAVLRDEIVNRLNRAMGKDWVKAVYFTDFIVQ